MPTVDLRGLAHDRKTVILRTVRALVAAGLEGECLIFTERAGRITSPNGLIQLVRDYCTPLLEL